MPTPLNSSSPLSGIRIIEIGRSDTIHVAGMLLADQGAEVIRINSAASGTNHTAFHKITDRAKQSFMFDVGSQEHAEVLRQLIRRADVLLEDLDRELELRFHLPPETLCSAIRCTVVPTDDPGFTGHWTEETVSALCGLYEDGLSIGGAPRFYDLPIAATLGALYSVNAVARALVGRQRFGAVDSVRIPLDRICLFAQSLTIMIRSKPPTRWEPFRWMATPFTGIWRTAANGRIYLHIGMPRHLRSFMFFLEKAGFGEQKERIRKLLHPATRRDPINVQRPAEALGIARILRRLFMQKSAEEWEDLLGNAGLCCTKVRTFEEWRNHPQVTETNQITNIALEDGTLLPVPGPLFDSFNSPPTSVAPRRPGKLNVADVKALRPGVHASPMPAAARAPLEGVRVVDLGRVIAGPYAGRLLAEAGAEVLQVSLRSNHLDWEEPFGIIYNRGKKSVAIDFSRPEGKAAFKKLLAWFKPDIVIHNFLDDAAKKIGCDYESCRRLDEKIICLEFKGYSRGGPWADHPGFEQNIQAASGILATFCGPTVPRILPVPLNDLCSGLIGSFGALLALLNRYRDGHGDRITAYISTPSILVHLPFLSKECAAERKRRFRRYFRASDTWFLLCAEGEGFQRLARLTLFEHNNIQGNSIDENRLAKTFRKKPVQWWIEAIHSAGADDCVAIIPRQSLSAVLKKELSRNNSLFSYRYHEAFGQVICSEPPLITATGQVKELSTAPYPGSHNLQVLNEAGIDPAPHGADVPAGGGKLSPVRQQFNWVLWILRQVKWLTVIAWRNRALRK